MARARRPEITNSVAAWELGRACFTWGKPLSGCQQQGKNLHRRASPPVGGVEPRSAGGAGALLFVNIGRVADLKRNLAAFGMVKEVERAFQQAVQWDENYAYGGPDRNLGLLY